MHAIVHTTYGENITTENYLDITIDLILHINISNNKLTIFAKGYKEHYAALSIFFALMAIW